MVLTHPQSAQGLNSGLNLFSVTPTDTSLLQGARWVEYSPVVPGVDPIEFTVPKGTGNFSGFPIGKKLGIFPNFGKKMGQNIPVLGKVWVFLLLNPQLGIKMGMFPRLGKILG